uniref:c-type cytochrome n=1 Tax=Flavobacterium sp. TaxID=239 RepID=UPI00404B00FA
MKKVGNHKSFSKIFFSVAFVLVTSLSAFAQDAAKGKELFNTNCGVASKYDKEWLYKWIKNSGELIKSGDAQAVKVFEENNKVPMTAFPQLSNEDIDNILAYTSEPKPEPVVADTTANGGGGNEESGVSNNLILGVLSLVMMMLVVMLFLVNN